VNRVKVVYESETVDADELAFKEVAQVLGAYEIEDGTIIEIRQEVKSIYRLCDKRKADGSPIYLLAGGAAVRTILKEA
jgi:hypothetical protein